MDVVRLIPGPLWSATFGDDYVRFQHGSSSSFQRGKNMSITADSNIKEVGLFLRRQTWHRKGCAWPEYRTEHIHASQGLAGCCHELRVRPKNLVANLSR